MTRARAHWRTGGGALAAGMALALASDAWSAAALDLYYERSLMAAADARCGLFSPAIGTALASAQAQARGAALRAGADEAALARTLASARAKAAAAACDGRDLAKAASRVRRAFNGYARLQRMTFAGETNAWEARRTASRDHWTWRLSQTAAFGQNRATFGLAGRGDDQPLTVVAGFSDRKWPYAARLVMRDPSRTPPPSAIRLRDGSPLAGRGPPRSAARILLARSRSLAPPLLLPSGFRTGVQFRFAADAVETLLTLDPREAVVVEFVFSGPRGDEVRAAYFEVGDFAAATTFLKVSAR